MGLNVDSLMNSLNEKAYNLQAKINDKNFDPSNAGDLLKMQLEVSNYQQISGLTSAIISDIKSAAQGIIQKV